MPILNLYTRVLRLLGPQARLGWALAIANVALALAQFAAPVLLGRINDALAQSQGGGPSLSWQNLLPLLATWVGFGLFMIVCSALVALFADRLAHRRRQAVLTQFWLDAVVGERGRALSGGERQRLSIARALLKDPPILILDEATNALDAATEAKVTAALSAVMKGRTTFVIAHRLATVRNATRILVFDQGRIVESGAFDELVRKSGIFAALAKAQFIANESF